MAVSWEFFSGRRSVTLREILEQENITCYEELFLKHKHMGVKAPPEETVSWMFNEKADKIKIPNDPNASMDDLVEAKKQIDEIILDGDPDALVPELHIPAQPGINKAMVPRSNQAKKPAPRKRRSARKSTKAKAK